MKTALVLEGGAKRGIYTAGVLDVLLENGIMTDGVLGVSAGAIHGCSYVARQAEDPVQSQVWLRLPFYEFPVIAFERKYGRYAILLS